MAFFAQNLPQWIQRNLHWVQDEFLDRGARIAAGQFSRKKWREVQDELRAKVEAEKAKEAAAAKAIQDAKDAEKRARARAAEQYRQDASIQAALQLHALQQSGADHVGQQVAALHQLGQQAIAAHMLAQQHASAMQANQDDEDEALALLLT